MNIDDKPATRADVKQVVTESVTELQEVLVGGMNQMLETLIRHIDGVDSHLSRVEQKLENTTDDLTQRVAKLEKQKV